MKINWGSMYLSLLAALVAALIFGGGSLAMVLTVFCGVASAIYFWENRLGWKETAVVSLEMGAIAFGLWVLVESLFSIGNNVQVSIDIGYVLNLLLPFLAAMLVFGQTARWVFGPMKKKK